MDVCSKLPTYSQLWYLTNAGHSPRLGPHLSPRGAKERPRNGKKPYRPAWFTARFDQTSEWATLRVPEDRAVEWLQGAARLLETPLWGELVGEIRLVPTADGYLEAVLTGRYEGLLKLAVGTKLNNLVAGEGFEPSTFGL